MAFAAAISLVDFFADFFADFCDFGSGFATAGTFLTGFFFPPERLLDERFTLRLLEQHEKTPPFFLLAFLILRVFDLDDFGLFDFAGLVDLVDLVVLFDASVVDLFGDAVFF